MASTLDFRDVAPVPVEYLDIVDDDWLRAKLPDDRTLHPRTAGRRMGLHACQALGSSTPLSAGALHAGIPLPEGVPPPSDDTEEDGHGPPALVRPKERWWVAGGMD